MADEFVFQPPGRVALQTIINDVGLPPNPCFGLLVAAANHSLDDLPPPPDLLPPNPCFGQFVRAEVLGIVLAPPTEIDLI